MPSPGLQEPVQVPAIWEFPNLVLLSFYGDPITYLMLIDWMGKPSKSCLLSLLPVSLPSSWTCNRTFPKGGSYNILSDKVDFMTEIRTNTKYISFCSTVTNSHDNMVGAKGRILCPHSFFFWTGD